MELSQPTSETELTCNGADYPRHFGATTVLYALWIQSPSEDSHYHDESVIGPPNHHVTMGLDP